MRQNLKTARKEKKMTQQSVADYLGVSERTYQRLEHGKTLGSIAHWDKLEDLFGTHQRQLRNLDYLNEQKGNQPKLEKPQQS